MRVRAAATGCTARGHPTLHPTAATHQNPAGVGRVVLFQQTDDGAFATAALAHQGQRLSGLHVQVNALENLRGKRAAVSAQTLNFSMGGDKETQLQHNRRPTSEQGLQQVAPPRSDTTQTHLGVRARGVCEMNVLQGDCTPQRGLGRRHGLAQLGLGVAPARPLDLDNVVEPARGVERLANVGRHCRADTKEDAHENDRHERLER